MPPPNLAPNKFQERSRGASRMQENLLAVGLGPAPAGGAYSAHPDPVASREEPAAPPRNPIPRYRPFGPRTSSHWLVVK